MPPIHNAIFARADAHAGLEALIGSPPRLFPVEAPQNVAVPYVTYSVVSAPRVHVMSADKDAQPRVQFDSWGATRTQALQVNAQVVACYDRWSGSFGGLMVLASVCENEGMDVERDEATLIPRVTSEFTVTYLL